MNNEIDWIESELERKRRDEHECGILGLRAVTVYYGCTVVLVRVPLPYHEGPAHAAEGEAYSRWGGLQAIQINR